jgi:tripartite-type tricarboxylate transporter receptor subunit TctC
MRTTTLIFVLAASLAPLPALGQLPTKPMRIIAPFAPGGPADVVSRAIGRELAKQMGQPVVVENRPGASGHIGGEVAARATPDGTTLFMTANSHHAISPLLYEKLNYDPNKELAPVSTLVSFRQVLIVNPGSGVNSVKDIISMAKARPGKITYASSGAGNVTHMAAVLFAHQTGIDIVHIPYKGSAPAITDTIAGHVLMMFDHIPSAQQHIRSGRVRAVATTGTRRDANLPDIPTVAESGVPGYETSVWFGLAVASATPKETVQALNAEVVKGAQAPEFVSTIGKLGYDITPSTVDQMAAMINAEIKLWGPIVRMSGAKAD